jgi:hypothetical protein
VIPFTNALMEAPAPPDATPWRGTVRLSARLSPQDLSPQDHQPAGTVAQPKAMLTLAMVKPWIVVQVCGHSTMRVGMAGLS